jgi:lipid-A-disaccharide synthase
LGKILVSAGEESGDLYASLLVKEIKKQRKDAEIIAFGGERVKKAGADLKVNLLKIAIIGFWEVVLNIFSIISILAKTSKILKQEKPDLLIVIDFPGFHLWLIEKARKAGVKKIIYWITPQIWAWDYDRIKTIKKYCDLCIVAFPFEKKIFEKEKIPVMYFGHPITEIIKINKSHRTGKKTNIGIFPGSRESEVKSFLPDILKACVLIKKDVPDAQFTLFKSKTIEHKTINNFLEKFKDLGVKTLDGSDLRNRSILDAAIVKSGTVTLENALLGIPMVVVYRVSVISYLITKMLIKVKFIALPNVIAGKMIVPELIQHNFTPEKICTEINRILKDRKYVNSIKKGYKEIQKATYNKNVMKNSVKAVLKEI